MLNIYTIIEKNRKMSLIIKKSQWVIKVIILLDFIIN